MTTNTQPDRPAAAHPNTDVSYMFDCALQWHVFGGIPAEHVFVNFGVAKQEFYRRLAQIVEDEAIAFVSSNARKSLYEHFCALAGRASKIE